MAALPAAQVALDAHRGVADVAEQGLAFLRNLSVAEASKVSWWACLFRSALAHLLASSLACMPSAPSARVLLCCCVQVPLMAVVWLAICALSVRRLFQDSGRVQYFFSYT